MTKIHSDKNSQAAAQSAADAWQAQYDKMSQEQKRQAWNDYYRRLRDRPAGEPYVPSSGGEIVVAELRARDRGFFSLRNQARSAAVGLTCGGVIIGVFMFALFNESMIAPFIRPSQTVGRTPVVDAAGLPVDTSSKVRIPKINVEIPLVYGLASTDAKQFELALDQGVAHYPTTSLPGQAGNAAFFGHSSNNIFNPGKYKFAFVLLHELQPGDTFYLTYDAKLYTYEVITKKVVKPSEVGVLEPVGGQLATASLITCDPPGTSTNRLVVIGKQVSPNPTSESVTVAPKPAAAEPSSLQSLPGNGPGLLNRIYRSVFGT